MSRLLAHAYAVNGIRACKIGMGCDPLEMRTSKTRFVDIFVFRNIFGRAQNEQVVKEFSYPNTQALNVQTFTTFTCDLSKVVLLDANPDHVFTHQAIRKIMASMYTSRLPLVLRLAIKIYKPADPSTGAPKKNILVGPETPLHLPRTKTQRIPTAIPPRASPNRQKDKDYIPSELAETQTGGDPAHAPSTSREAFEEATRNPEAAVEIPAPPPPHLGMGLMSGLTWFMAPVLSRADGSGASEWGVRKGRNKEMS
ncbi:hypothetical protein BDP27DRAFT_1482096 [Rhodocollybia butyracea]|uniref:Uncharacterized protein n=1 Tax=Rhodocollybia butyracea TaxID=206335 RepID=A0A9P5PH50_9AGAR|nr:hypothetical protein BDP27DRAFT_1482096 [Rhodocollybia butyracea]